MKTAREIIAGELPVSGADENDVADAILAALAAEGYRIVPPGGVHEPTREAAAKVAMRRHDMWLTDGYEVDYSDVECVNYAGECETVAQAIRSLEATHGE